MVCYDKSITPAIEAQKNYINNLLEKKEELTDSCTKAENNMTLQFGNFRTAQNIFGACSDDKATLEANLKKTEEAKAQQIKELEEEMEAKILQAQRDNKGDTEINAIRAEYATKIYNVENSYADKIANLKYNITIANTMALTKYKTLAQADLNYRNSRFENIFATGNFLNNQSSLFTAYLDLGKMQNNQFINEYKLNLNG